MNRGNTNESHVREGFLCPICHVDLYTPEKLTFHFENVHSEEQDLVKSFKDVFSKILNKPDAKTIVSKLDVALNDVPRVNAILSKNQKHGASNVDYKNYFHNLRDKCLERYTTETNKLVIRLEKLLTNLPTDPIQRKPHEQSIVPWLEEKHVHLCPICAKTFNLARRKHHCRLCGSIMCNSCSVFIHFKDTKDLSSYYLNINTHETGKDIKWKSLRICDHCLRLLEKRKHRQNKTYLPKITELYGRIMTNRSQIVDNLKKYTEIVESLQRGEVTYSLQEAETLRRHIGQHAELVDNDSKRILMIEVEQGTKEFKLKNAIRLACVQFIKEAMMSVPILPAEQELQALLEQRRLKLVKQIEDARLSSLRGTDDTTKHYSTEDGACGFGVSVTTLDNWTCEQKKDKLTGDPIVEQINIISHYLKEAKLAGRKDEVAVLEENLVELKQEFYRQQQNK